LGSVLKIYFSGFEICEWEQQEFISFWGEHHIYVYTGLCFNINPFHFLLKIFTNNYISGGFGATEKIQADTKQIRVGIQD
jgi:hypothetical protein